MSNQDHLSNQIDNKLRNLSPNHSTCSIFKVPSRLRRVNERAYEPEILSIGPYHRGKHNLKMMEEHKKRYLLKLLERRKESSVARYVTAMRVLEERARSCYDQSIGLGRDEFVEMLLLDGCFIVELIRKCNIPRIRDSNDPVIDLSWILSTITADMCLLENQLPLFVLWELFTMTTGPNHNEDFFAMTLGFFQWMFPGSGLQQNNTSSVNEYKHLLDIIYYNWQKLPSPPDMYATRNETKDNDWEFIRCATELKEAGIKFKKLEVSSSRLFDGVCFENGRMEIPCLKIYDTTESLLRNLVAYEQCSQLTHLYVTDYTTLMDCLINTKEDVQILRHSGIIENGMGDDEMVCNLFNKLGTNVMLPHRNHFHYAQVFHGVKEHCNQRRYVWLFELRHNYFKSPWAWLSFLAALALLLLTLLQTLFTVMSYFEQNSGKGKD